MFLMVCLGLEIVLFPYFLFHRVSFKIIKNLVFGKIGRIFSHALPLTANKEMDLKVLNSFTSNWGKGDSMRYNTTNNSHL